jgi:hypothetical protein
MGKVQQGRPSRLSLEKGNDGNPNEPSIELWTSMYSYLHNEDLHR